MNAEYERHVPRRRHDESDAMEKPESKPLSFRTVITMLGALVVVIVPASVLFAHLTTADTQAAQVPALQSQMQLLQNGLLVTQSDVTMLKERRVEDSGNMRDMRNEVMGKLDVIERKLDDKADKPQAGISRFQR